MAGALGRPDGDKCPWNGKQRYVITLLQLVEWVSRMSDETLTFSYYRGNKEPSFATRTELEAAKLFDYHRIAWEYEPRTFVLEQDERGGILEAFTPDFYLPDLDLFVEVTEMKQSLVTVKNRKVRKLRERYPEVRIKLLYRRDFVRLAQKYGL
jgi:hypothetical protein